ncbi:AraC family transcriptional regulator [Terricaulis sp.]|uniref:AraC family transcriptional regulator n=1 Tax=Terricaulis sp. TaxID=2768686 RepID=UPI003782FF75
MDVLSDVLRNVRLTGAVYFDVNAREPWVAETPATSRICAQVMPAFEHAISFHIMLDGICWAQLADESEPPVKLSSGDAVIFIGGEGHFMGSVPGKRAEPNMDLYVRPSDRPLPFLLNGLGGEGKAARFVCGYLGCDARPFNPILEALPRMLRVPANQNEATTALIRMALAENEKPRAGGETILSKLSELMFLQAIRAHIDTLPAESIGWLSGLRDRHVGRALTLMHGRPGQDWTLDALAKEVGLSRSAFAERFTELMGVPPMSYLGNWRLQVAARLLEAPSMSIAQAAAQVGYESEAAFNRAFKKQVGLPPGAWRRSRANGGRLPA